MQCDICGKKKATVHLTEIVDEQMSEMHLCEECARSKSAQMEQQFGLGDLLAGLSDAGKSGKAETKQALTCSGCGINYEDFRKFGRLGCGLCYESFKEHLSGLLKKIHGSSRHLGKVPLGTKLAQDTPADKTNEKPVVVESKQLTLEQLTMPQAPAVVVENVDDLKKQLQAAIKGEDFERAAQLRDRIRQLESGS